MSGEKDSLRELPSVQNGIEDVAGCVGNPVRASGVDEGIDKAGRRRVVSRFGGRLGSKLRLWDLGRVGLDFGGGNSIVWLFTCGLVLVFAEPLSFVDLCLDGRDRGLQLGWGEAAGIHSGRDQSLDGYDHGESLDLAGDGAPESLRG